MSLLGTLEQFPLPNVLRRLEAHEKTGLLVVRQAVRWVEFYVRNGHLLCIGPVRTSATLGDRLLHDEVISCQAWQEVKEILGNDEQSETRLALALMERGYVTREQLRAWTTEKSRLVLSAVLAWTSGEIYFEESTPPPSDRLLVSMSITLLIETASVNVSSPLPQPAQTTSVVSHTAQLRVTEESLSLVPPSSPSTSPTTPTAPALCFAKLTSVKSKADIAHVPTLMEASQFFGEAASSSADFLPTPLSETDSFASLLNGNKDLGMQASSLNMNEISFASFISTDGFTEGTPLVQPERVEHPVPSKRADTSLMLPDMVLVPADISALRVQNSKVQITPDQWRVLTCVDGRNSLQMTCQLLGLLPDVVCSLVGELVAAGLISVVSPEQVNIPAVANASRGLAVPDMAKAHVAPGYTANPASPWSTVVPALPSTNTLPVTSAALSFETESQWGNGGNGATFIPGRGWVTTPQPIQPLSSQGPLTSPQAVYAQVGR